MGKEIERKFLVNMSDEYLKDRINSSDCDILRQGYIVNTPDLSVRIRSVEPKVRFSNVSPAENKFILTVKSGQGVTREENEMEVPKEQAELLFGQCSAVLKKERYYFLGWEIDVFKGANEGLVLAEREIESEDEEFFRPLCISWLGEEVTLNPQYLNANLIKNEIN